MRAGKYADFEGVTYVSGGTFGSFDHGPVRTFVRLFAPESDPPPPGFELSRRGEWTRVVDLLEVSRMFYVETTAVWQGYAVSVDSVEGNEALIWYMGLETDMPSGVSPIDNGIWQGMVPVSSLKEVVEKVLEAPL